MTVTDIAVIDSDAATAAQIREWSVVVRERIPDMTQDELDQLEALLAGVKRRLRQLGEDIAETERTRIRAWQRKGELLGKGKPGDYNRVGASLPNTKDALTPVEWQERHRARLLADYPEIVDQVVESKKPSLNKAVNLAKRQRAADEAAKVAERMAEAITAPADDVITRGQWWQLGEHLLYCGDSADDEFLKRANGATFAFADPPYNAGKADWDEGFVWRHDYLAEAAEIVAVTPGIAAIADFFGVTTMPYRWSMTAWITNGMTRGPLGFGNWIYLALFSGAESLHRNAQDVLRISVDAATSGDTNHESRKPARLLIDLIELFSDEGDTIIDPFLGSGTTLFAADKTGRRCIGAEINPRYYNEIIAKFGSEAVLL